MDLPETEPIAVIAQRMKWLVIVSTVLFIGACIGMRWGIYLMGSTCYERGDYPLWLWLLVGLPPLQVFIGFLLFILVNLLKVVIAISFRGVLRTASLCLLLTYGALFAVLWIRQPTLFLAGFRQYVVTRVSLEDLRQIRKVIIATREVSNQGDVHRVERRSAPVPGASDFNSRWDIYYSEEPTFGKRWQQICEQTKIEKLIGKGGVNIQSDGDTATLRWGGGFEEWGITITAERIEIGLDPNHAEIRLADDIVLFDGD